MDAMSAPPPLVEAHGLTKHFSRSGGGFFGRGAPRAVTRAVDGLDFRIGRGETVGLLGESGSGKTTTGRLLLRLTEPSDGEIHFDGANLGTLRGTDLRTFRTRAQLVFQNPFDALNPRFTMRQSLAEPLINAGVPKPEREDRMQAVLKQVHLPDALSVLNKFPHQMSGGQLQRVVLARALILRPDFIVADEPVSMLDVSVRAGILNVMRDVRDAMGLAAIYISHDVTLVRYVCARTLVMYRGRIVEDGPTAEVVRRPRHPYTQALISAVPVPRVEQNRAPLLLRQSRGGSLDLSVGCGFRDRCPHAFDRCTAEKPVLSADASVHRVACHLDS
jgi:oligopeptide/dipeptide ABC transporter ATP-binding protein